MADERAARGREWTEWGRRDLIKAALAGGALLATGGLAAACGGDDEPSTGTTPGTSGGGPSRGGTLRVGIGGGGPQESLDPYLVLANSDLARSLNLTATLMSRDPATLALSPSLAESIEPNADGTEWTVRLVQGAEFHNGKTIGADDLIFSVQRHFELNSSIKAMVDGYIDPAGLKKADDRTVTFRLLSPSAVFREPWAMIASGIVPADFNPAPDKFVGSGPFKLKSFTPGEQTVMQRFENYFGQAPYVDECILVSFNDDASRVNALLGNQVDVAEALPGSQVELVRGTSGLGVIESASGATRFFTMRCDQAPFDDVRVRQAMRLIANRAELVAQSLAGFGRPASDLFNDFDRCYASDLVREQDIEGAKKLLAEAGQSDLTVELAVAPYINGIVEASTVFAEQAKAAGVTVKLNQLDLGAFFAEYGSWAFASDFFNANDYFVQVALNQLPTSIFNTTGFDDAEYNELYAKALAELDDAKRCDIAKQMQKIEFERGGNLVYAFASVVDGISSKVGGFVPDRYGLPLSSYNFARAYFV